MFSKIKPNYDLNGMKARQTLADITRTTIEGLDKIFEKERPDMVLVQGDAHFSLAVAAG